MKRVLVWGSIVVVLLIGVAIGGYVLFLRPTTARALTGSSARVTREDLDVLVKCQGLIVAATTIEVKSRASGYVQKVHATAGDRVKKDQILLEVDPARSKLNEEEARSEVETARSQLRLTEESLDTERIALLRTRVERQRQLMEKGLIKREDLEQVEYELASAERSLRSQQKQLEATRARLETALTRLRRAENESSFTIIRAPIDGIVMDRAVELGSGVTSFSDSVQGGTVLFRIGSLDQPAFEGTLAISDLTKVKPGLTAKVTSDAWPEAAPGVVSYVGQEAQTDDRTKAATFEVKIQLDTVARDRPLNVPAVAEIIVSKLPNALVVPLACVQHRPGGQAMLRETAGGGTRERLVKLGPSSGTKVQIIGDVAEGTTIAGCGAGSADRPGSVPSVIR